MTAVFWYIGIPLVLCAALACITAVSLRESARFSALALRLLIGAGASVALFTLLHMAVVFLFAANSTPFDPIAVAAVSFFIQLGLLFPKTDRFAEAHPKRRRFLQVVGVLAVAALIGETFIGNAVSLCTSYQQASLPLTTAQLTDNVYIEDDNVVVQKDGTLTIKNDIDGARAIGLRFTPTEHPVRLTVKVCDDNFSSQEQTVLERLIPTDTGEVYLPLNTYGALHSLSLYFSSVKEPLTLHEVLISNAVPFSFSVLRLLATLALGSLIAAIWLGRWHTRLYDRRKRSHKLLALGCLAVCIALNVAMIVPYYLPDPDNPAVAGEDTKSSLAYPIDTAAGYDPYVQQFDAFQKGQLHLDIEPDPTLLSLSNPYDNSLRNGESPVYYQWDRAFYNGRYYSYFGVTPLFTFYYPYYFVTGMLPRLPVACGVFAAGATVFLFLFVLKLIRQFCGKVNLPALLSGLLAAVSISGIYWYQLFSDLYNLPLLSGLCFLFMTLWLGLCGYTAKHPAVGALCLFGCGVGVVLTVGSRPTMILGALVLAPLFIHILVRKDFKLGRKLSSAAAFLVPVAAGAAALMVYNALRFDSPLEFGSTYQLTVSNIAANTVTLSLLPAALYHYFLQPASVNGQFPFVHPSYMPLGNYGRYMYIETSLGALTVPHILAAAASLPMLLKRAFKRHPVKFWFFAIAPVLAIVAAFCDLCLGGVNLRYLADFLPLLAALAVPLVLELHHRLGRLPRVNDRHFPLTFALFVGSIVLGACVFLTAASTSTVINDHFPQLLPALENVVAFWR